MKILDHCVICTADEEEPYCSETKNCEVCHWGGNKEKCDHLREHYIQGK